MKITVNDFFGFLKASRIPNLVIIGLTQFITAYFLLNVPLWMLMKASFILFILSTGMIGAAGYIINDYFDQKIDMINRPNEVIVGTTFRRRFALLAHALLTMTGIGIGFIIDPAIGAIHIFSSGALWVYSTVLKRWILLGTLTISFLTCLTLLLVLVYFRQFSLLVVAYALFGCVIVFIRESIKDIISAKGEVLFGIQSIPIVWGIRGAKLMIFLAGSAGMAMLSFYLYSLPNWNVRYFFFAVLIFILWIAYRLAKADKMKDFKIIRTYVDMIIVAGLASMLLV
ncbi:4-hydroxybenzoate polyprenyltransferase [Ekhidna lutea]|uniref:4-hydroxybenzoate polyprenyltransferase n=1 Tax=Ekhidna lutea TaxID=447679 RepID=A0A239FGJ2_EKHLU|nr:geranylgeranylglycerol-phosphate geranylgeranyltransferase [Ekhidna lutea]SNS55184.1 4-hydroxybenzoate polyprenyltransferase [Ekhidna lutea]